MKTIRQILNGIYKANQCTDINDVDFAISECKNLISTYGESRLVYNRINSLMKKRQILAN